MTIYPMDTYALEVRWSTVRMMLVMICTFDLRTHDIDFSNAFGQAEQNVSPVYMTCPSGVGLNSYDVLLLKKSLYGQVGAPDL